MKALWVPLVLLSLALTHPANAALETQVSNQLRGKTIQDFQADTWDGKKFSLSSLRGKPIIVNFFTSWCPVCGYEIADLVKAQPGLAQQGITILGVLADPVVTPDTIAEAVQKLREQPLPYTVVMMNSSMKPLFNYEGFPATYFVNKDGVFADTLLGYHEIDKILLTASQIATGNPISAPALQELSIVRHWPWESHALRAFWPTVWKNWHPALVHFPIVLLLLEGILVFLCLARPNANLERQARLLLTLSLFSLVPVLFTGFHDAGNDLGPGSATWNGLKDRIGNFFRFESTVSLHFILALSVVFLTAVRFAWRTYTKKQSFKGRQGVAFAFITALALWLMFAAGQVGGGISHS